MPSWSCDRVRIGPNKFPPEIAIDAPTANIAASRCRGCFSGHYEHIGGAWDHHRPRVVPFPKRVKKTWPSTAYSFAPPDPFVPIQVPTPTYLGPSRGWSRWRGVPGRYYGNPFCLSGATSTKANHCAWSCLSLTEGVERTCSCSLPGACTVEFTGFLPSKISAFTDTLSAKKRNARVLTES